MPPRLIAVAGPLKGAQCSLKGEEVSVGRDASNALCVGDPSVSRRHCLLRMANEVWTIVDLDTRNGTFVNAMPVKQRALHDRDEIRMGGSVFYFLTGEGEPPLPARVTFADAGYVTRSATIVPGDSSYLRPEKLALGARHSREMKALIEIGTTLATLRGVPSMERRLMERVFEILPAERGAILLAEGENAEFTTAFGWERGRGHCPAPALPREELQRALRERLGVLSERHNAESLLAAPLLSPAGALGVIALQAAGAQCPFDEAHLEWLSAAALMAGPALESARRLEWLEEENRRLQAEINLPRNMVGESPGMREVFRQIARAAPADSTVLICGETGTGKELVARAVHAASARSGRAFVAINCATLSETLLESELFGHEKGAFTGAVVQKRGKIEMAEGGTLFLDEIGELASALQAKLLRVLQEREFERVGGTRPIRADIRLIAATNRDLERAVEEGSFRRDLYYRIHVIAIQVPPLRERREDIPLLATYFLSRCAEKAPRRIAGISAPARGCLNSYDWPGNVRELENAIERAVVLGSSELIEPEDLPEAILERESPACAAAGRYHEAMREAKRRIIAAAIEEAQGSFQEAARRLGLNPTYLSRLVRSLDLKRALRRGAGE